VLELRRRFPARPEWAGRRVCDGQQVLDTAPGTLPATSGRSSTPTATSW